MEEPLSLALLNALAHPIRLQALVVLERGDLSPAGLAEALSVDEPVVMNHLHLLEDAGLVSVDFDTGELHATASGWSDIARNLQALQDEAS